LNLHARRKSGQIVLALTRETAGASVNVHRSGRHIADADRPIRTFPRRPGLSFDGH